MHEGVACNQCHVKMVFTDVGSKCADCHADIHRRQFGANCEQCHNVRGWNVAVQQINQHQNRFPLIGAHAALECDSCHKGAATGQFQGLSTQCYSCHAKDFQKTNAPAHLAAGFSTTCEQCHGVDNWFGVNFDHLKFTGFALTGAHASLQCNQCHINNQFKGTSANCVSCHLKDFQSANNPNHVAGGFSQTCQQCHNTTTWVTTTFDHNTTGFPLTGAHASVQCAQCHINNNYQITNTSCVSCHVKDFQATTNPNHSQQGFSQTCDQCHNTAAWNPAKFDHSLSGFPLTGAHASVQCTLCHVNNNYNISDTSCVSCHLKDFQSTTSPSHVQANFPQACQQCHNTTNWGGASFNHATTGFALTGAHATLQCTQCHNTTYSPSGAYNLTSGTCATCHMTDYRGTNNPSHVASNFPLTCEQCHSTTSWLGANFNHATTGFALTGTHTTLQCGQCHNTTFSPSGPYNLASGACITCHMTDFQGTTNPSHVQANFPQTCEQCHNTTNWGNGTFNHAATGFVLTGMHVSPPLACAQCHNTTFSPSGPYNLTTTACVGCHLNVYQTANNPNHAQVGFPQTCEMCHDTVNWMNGTFNHNKTQFPLTGYHATAAVTCAMCHVNNNYTTLPLVCSGCHMAAYNSTTNPNHQAAGWPTTCDTCHTVPAMAWIPATLPTQYHTFFSVNHGNANGVCATCHQNQSDYSVFQCTNCHGGGNAANFHHPNVSGYVYNSVNCYQCHKR